MPPALFPGAAGIDAAGAPSLENPFLEALRAIGDTQPFDEDGAPPSSAASPSSAPGGADAERGTIRRATVSFRMLHDAIASALPDQASALYAYAPRRGPLKPKPREAAPEGHTDPEAVVPGATTLADPRVLARAARACAILAGCCI